ncbi:sulfate adenylyltransferase subunit CysN [Buchnera aphidicola (Muscaphis stroyani)]|uniref:Sulfate adenylyltransferase subunit 1 n=1 Tax=Buchnera aphidicola (Muscaphis stroyani) TaxID=1241869 RepID=A0A4D6YD09_9GAMM|nr:sulfate adenylyltransferase subunit CysN [Buchnera aphidicola]QCI24471.1 sulfate adenylyltransferase subunit CysN [Buchnera aphidicola (Muscaphis stroyani)]
MNTIISKKEKFKNWLNIQQKKTLLKLLTCGSVDDGKSTLIGRLLHDTQQIYDDQLTLLKDDSKRHGTQGDVIDFALLVDGLHDEREQGITIDVAYRYFSTNKRKFIVADTPGHKQYTCNMVTGASTCEASILLVDVTKGLLEQTYRHSFISILLGIKYLIVAVNKMDLVNYKEKIFIDIKNKFLDFAKQFNNDLKIFFVPISALVGENIVFKNNFMPWYNGHTLLKILETINIKNTENLKEMRFPVQYINRPNSEFRGYSGTLVSGDVYVGQKVKILPININSFISRIVVFNEDIQKSESGQSITIVLKDEIDISRGDLFVNFDSPLKPCQEAIVDVVWMSENNLFKGQAFYVKSSNKKTRVRIKEILYKIEINTLTPNNTDSLSLNSIGRIKVEFNELMMFDSYKKNRITGSMIFIDLLSNLTVGAGMIVENISNKKNMFSEHQQSFEKDLYSLIRQYFPHWKIR